MSWILFLQKIHGHVALLGIALAFHPVITLSKARALSYRIRLSAYLATLFAFAMNALGWWIYPAYRQEIKRDFYLANPLFGDAFEVKEHLGLYALALALAGALIVFRAPDRPSPETVRTIRWTYGLSATLALIVGAIGIWLSSIKGFAYPLS